MVEVRIAALGDRMAVARCGGKKRLDSSSPAPDRYMGRGSIRDDGSRKGGSAGETDRRVGL